MTNTEFRTHYGRNMLETQWKYQSSQASSDATVRAWIFNCIFKNKKSFMKSVDEKITFINIHDLWKNYMMN